MEPIFAHIIVATLAAAGVCRDAAVSAVTQSPVYEFAATLAMEEVGIADSSDLSQNKYLWAGIGGADESTDRAQPKSQPRNLWADVHVNTLGDFYPEAPPCVLWESGYSEVHLRPPVAKATLDLQAPNPVELFHAPFGERYTHGIKSTRNTVSTLNRCPANPASKFITLPNVKLTDEERYEAADAKLAAIDSYLQPLVNWSLLGTDLPERIQPVDWGGYAR